MHPNNTPTSVHNITKNNPKKPKKNKKKHCARILHMKNAKKAARDGDTQTRQTIMQMR